MPVRTDQPEIKMRRVQVVLACFALLVSHPLLAAPAKQFLPTGQGLTPWAAPRARFTPLVARVGPHPAYVADGASAIAVSPDKREMLVLTSGYNRFNGADGKLLPQQSTQYIFRYAIGRGGAQWLQTLQVPNSFGGIAWLPNGNGFIVGGGIDDALYLFARENALFRPTGKIPLGHGAGLGADVKPQAAGVAVDPAGHRAIVANYYNDSVTLLDLDRKTVLAEQDLRPGKIDPGASGIPGGEFPYAIAWTDARHAWVSAPRDRQLVSLAITNGSMTVTGRVTLIGEPTTLLYDARARQLIATEDNDDRLAILDLASGKLAGEPRLRIPSALAPQPLGKG